MKIGVITWFNSKNYGTVLQAIAMQEILIKNNVDPYIVNFDLINVKKKGIIKYLHKPNYYINNIERFIHPFKYNRKIKKIKNVIYNNFKLTRLIENDKEFIDICNSFDALIFGSDQIWNPNWYHPYYFGNFDQITTKKYSYAPSLGINNIQKYSDKIKNAINRFEMLSLREKDTILSMSKLTNKKIENVVDPTFLLSALEWAKYEQRDFEYKKDYILCYMLSDNKNHWNAIINYAKKKKLQLVIIPYTYYSNFLKGKKDYDVDISRFLSLIKNSTYVITDSFHASVFSIIYKKNFYVFERHEPKSINSQNSRIYNLLSDYELSDRLINYNSKIISDKEMINYNIVYKHLNKNIERSINYINMITKGKKQ